MDRILQPQEVRGNTAGNVNNFGFAAGDGEWIYFSDTWDIFRVHNDRVEAERISKGLRPEGSVAYRNTMASLNLYNGWLVYEDQLHSWNLDDLAFLGSAASIRKYELEKSELSTLRDDNASSINVVDGWIYYINNSDNQTVYRMNVDGSARKMPISEPTVPPLHVANGWIYSLSETGYASWTLWRTRIDDVITGTGNQERVSDLVSANLVIDNGWVYWEMANDIYRQNIQDGEQQILGNGTLMNVSDGWMIYFSRLFSEDPDPENWQTVLYRMSTDGT